MSHVRYLGLPVAVGAALLLSGALAQQSQQPAQPAKPAAPTPPPSPPPKADPDAVKAFDKALERFGPKQTGWLKTTIWQHLDVQGLTYGAEGVYLSGPNHRFRLDLKVRIGGTEGESQSISDGQTVWQAIRIGDAPREVSKYVLKPILETLNAPGIAPQVRDGFFQEQMFTGVAPLLQNLQQQLVFTKKEANTWNGRQVLLLTGVWNVEMAKALGPNDRWREFMPRKCVLFLDAQESWPLRLEWWGPAPPRPDDALLIQMEFRDPTLVPADAKTADDFLRNFTFNEKGQTVTDMTKNVTEELRNRARQFAAQKKTSPPAPSAPTPK